MITGNRSARPSVSVIVSTYRRPQALTAVLVSLSAQRYGDFEVVVADDGSGAETKRVVDRFAALGRPRIRHAWQEDRGWRLAASRNGGILASECEYLVFIDGDCVTRPDFVAHHARLAERGWFVRGSRVRLGPGLTRRVLSGGAGIHEWSTSRWMGRRLRGDIDRCLPLVSLPLGPLRKTKGQRWEKATGYNLGVWRDDVVAVNGFDEAYEGWGSEDTDFVMRLSRHGLRLKEGRLAVPILHLWHPAAPRDQEPRNLKRYRERLKTGDSRVREGLDRHLVREGP